MIDHLGLPVSDLAKSRAFYEAALLPLGFRLLFEHPISGLGFGRAPMPSFFIRKGQPVTGLHLAFSAPDREAVDAFHRAALAAGGRDNGAPRPRPEYHRGYYGAFVLDPDGHNVEAVCHTAPCARWGSAFSPRS